jgi:3-hydroxyisobutyrate dehydrogenase-like beta-hydroxyacid dehydrogenase
MTMGSLGFAGLGQMGGPMAANIAKGGFALVVYDKAGTAKRTPAKTTPVESLAELAKAAETIFISLPDGPACLGFARDLAAVKGRKTKVVIDLSTIGLKAAREMDKMLAAAGIVYVDAPVSGGQSGAKAGTITLMWSGPAELLESHRKALQAFSKNQFHVGPTPGQGQAVKMLNNFLSATAMAATTEAVSFGLSQGLNMKTILDVVNVSTGRNTATSDKFVNRILPGTFDAGFKTKLLTKDVRLFYENAKAAGTPNEIATLMADIWRRADEAMPDTDFTRIYSFMRGEHKTKN